MSGPDLTQAQKDVEEKSEHFEEAMDQLGEKVGVTIDKVGATIATIKKPKQNIVKLAKFAGRKTADYGNRTREKTRALINRAKPYSDKAADHLRQNRQAYIVGVAAAFAGILFATFRERRRFNMIKRVTWKV